MSTTNEATKTNAQRDAPPTVGMWPEPAPKWGLWATAAMWLAWAAFLIWMMFLRIAHG